MKLCTFPSILLNPPWLFMAPSWKAVAQTENQLTLSIAGKPASKFDPVAVRAGTVNALLLPEGFDSSISWKERHFPVDGS